MRIGMLAKSMIIMDSIKHVFETAYAVLRERHELVYRPPEYIHSRRSEQEEINKKFLLESDVIFGTLDEVLLKARESNALSTPFICLLLGLMPRGAFNMRSAHQLLRTTDVLVGNCTGDLQITNKFFTNANARLLRFAFDESIFYPMDEASRQAAKMERGFSLEDNILLYSGRLMLEKNVHTVLRIFRMLQNLIPKLHLVIAGNDDYDHPFYEFGVFPVGIKNTLTKVVAKLEIDEDRVHFVGRMEAKELRVFYNIANAVINMTLHHDENFGYAQVESMACGTPVIGTNWGGLRDTIVDDETGYKISTIVTASGIKINWWEAVNKIAWLLNNSSQQLRLRQNCRKYVVEKYSLSQYRRDLESILRECHSVEKRVSEPLAATPFAQEFWSSCAPQRGKRPPYQRSSRGYQLYQEMIAPYTGISQDCVDTREQSNSDHIFCLATPVASDGESITIDDPIFPFKIAIPDNYREAIHAVLQVIRTEPVIAVEQLTNHHLLDHPNARDAVMWMVETGLLLRTRCECGSITPGDIDKQMSLPLFSFQDLELSADFVVFR